MIEVEPHTCLGNATDVPIPPQYDEGCRVRFCRYLRGKNEVGNILVIRSSRLDLRVRPVGAWVKGGQSSCETRGRGGWGFRNRGVDVVAPSATVEGGNVEAEWG